MNQFAMKGCLEKQHIKKGQIYKVHPFLKFLCPKSLSKTIMSTELFLENRIFLVVKNHFPLYFVKNAWLKHLILHLCPWVWFSSQKFFSHDVLPSLMEKTKWTYVLLLLEECHFSTTNFDLWMSKGAHNVFALVINF
jgi:hypothetical protein